MLYEASGAKEIMQNKELTREQVESICVDIESMMDSDGISASDFLKHDAALRARVAELDERNRELEEDFLIVSEQRKAERRQLATVTAERGTCRWTEDEEGFWKTACGHIHCLEEGGPIDNYLRFCGYCGKGLVEQRWGETQKAQP
jgi:hypothetical protein